MSENTHDRAIARLSGIYPLADDDPRWHNGPRAVVEAALAARASVVQIRLKRTAGRDALELVLWAAEQTRRAQALLIVNDSPELAEMASADGVHLGQDDLPPEAVPAELRAHLLVGLSTHTLDQVRESRERPVDYIAFGPVFGTTSKDAAGTPLGVDLLAEAVQAAAHPVVAIGGISSENAGKARAAGACSIAVISAIADAKQPASAALALRRAFEETGGGEGE